MCHRLQFSTISCMTTHPTSLTPMMRGVYFQGTGIAYLLNGISIFPHFIVKESCAHAHHEFLLNRARAPSPEDLHSKKGRLGLPLFPTPISTKKTSKGHHQIDTSMEWDYACSPLSPPSGISESDNDSETQNEK